MKRKAIWSGVVLVLVLVVVAAAAAGAGLRRGRGWCGHGWRRGGPLGYVAHELDLSKPQITQARLMVVAERPAVAVLLGELLDEAHQMADATRGGNFDEAKVREIAATEGNTFAKLLLEKELLKSRMYATVLNENQRKSADELQQRWLGRLDHAVSRMQNQSR
jgi:Spy/CpxP family protein refolding chaperone